MTLPRVYNVGPWSDPGWIMRRRAGIPEDADGWPRLMTLVGNSQVDT